MKYSLNWLKEYLKTDKSPEELGQIMAALGSDVEDIQRYPKVDEKVVVAEIKDISPHPNADRLSLAKVATGEAEITVVCGAPNIEVGQKVAYAQVGAKVLGFEIEEAEIRGQKSPGMLLSPRELGVSSDHRGIHVFENSCEIGKKVADLLGQDVVLEAEITPNRGDLLSHFGMARDIGAHLKKQIDKPDLKIKEADKKVKDEISVEIKSDKCPLYLARVIKDVKIKESPDWLKERLIACGAKPINNVVDVTNFILLDLGHPLHAFDKSKLSGDKIVVKEVENDMDVVTLDDEARVLLPEMLGIWDSERPIAIAGVMGLKNSEVDENTQDIVLEAAVFDRKSIRKTAKLLGLKTEASARFERGIDETGVKYAIDKAAKLIQEVAGGEIGETAQAPAEYRIKNQELRIEYEKINQYADLDLQNEEIDKILENLGFRVKNEKATVPSWRHDISIWQDLAEEVYRINGINKISSVVIPSAPDESPSSVIPSAPGKVEKSRDLHSDEIYHQKEAIKDYLAEIGLDEAISYSFLSAQDVAAAKLQIEDLLEVANPVQEENRYMRNSLIPGLLKAVSKNPSFDDIEFFELGSVFSKGGEWMNLAIVTSGKQARPAEDIAKKLCEKFAFDINSFNIYEISQEELQRFKIKKPRVSVAEAKIPDLLKAGKFDDLALQIKEDGSIYRPISKFPPVKRDLAFVVDQDVPVSEIRNLMLEISSKAVLAEIFDEFSSHKLGSDKKSVAFHIWLQDLEKTLLDEEADNEISKIISGLKEKFGAKLRE